jgi:hypothetical protein
LDWTSSAIAFPARHTEVHMGSSHLPHASVRQTHTLVLPAHHPTPMHDTPTPLHMGACTMHQTLETQKHTPVESCRCHCVAPRMLWGMCMMVLIAPAHPPPYARYRSPAEEEAEGGRREGGGPQPAHHVQGLMHGQSPWEQAQARFWPRRQFYSVELSKNRPLRWLRQLRNAVETSDEQDHRTLFESANTDSIGIWRWSGTDQGLCQGVLFL